MEATRRLNVPEVSDPEWGLGRTTIRLLGMTALVVVMILVRVVYTGQPTHVHMAWNLFLAWLPFLFAGLALRPGQVPWPARLAFGLAWLLFLPNAPYLITDLMHLHRGGDVPLLYDVVLLFGAALCGLVLGLASLRSMLAAAAERLGVWASRLLGLGVLGAVGYGIYLGRYQRWNSWDALFRPAALVRDVWQHLRHPVQHWQAWALVVLMATLLALAYGLLTALGGAGAERR